MPEQAGGCTFVPVFSSPLCGSTLNSMKNARKGQREGICHTIGVLPVVRSKAIINHTRLRWVQACGEGESGAFLLKIVHCMRLTPPPHKNIGKTRKYNRHNTLSPFENDPLCSLNGEIELSANGF
jgi:hypothetical protein